MEAELSYSVGLGETDEDMIDMFTRLSEREVVCYLFCFKPRARLTSW